MSAGGQTIQNLPLSAKIENLYIRKMGTLVGVIIFLIGFVITVYLIGPGVIALSRTPFEENPSVFAIALAGLIVFGILMTSCFFIEPVLNHLYPVPTLCPLSPEPQPENCVSGGGFVGPGFLHNVDKLIITFLVIYFTSVFIGSFVSGWLGANGTSQPRSSLISGLVVGGGGIILVSLVLMIIAVFRGDRAGFGITLVVCLGIPASVIGLSGGAVGNMFGRRWFYSN